MDTVKALAGDKFDQAKFDELKDADGFVTKEALLALAAPIEPTEPTESAAVTEAEPVAAKEAPAPITIPLTDMINKIDEAVAAGLTPLICDVSGSKADTFFSYGGANGRVFDAKEARLVGA